MSTATAAPPTLDIVKARNVGDKPYTCKHDRYGNITIEPGETRVIPLPVALVCFGNPGAVDDKKNRFREWERKHVWGYHGFHPGIMPAHVWEDKKPPIEIYDLQDNRIWMVHDDPYGEKAAENLTNRVTEATDPDAIMRRALKAQEDAAKAKTAEIEAELTQSERNQLRDIPDEPATEPKPKRDKPRTSRSGSRRAK